VNSSSLPVVSSECSLEVLELGEVSLGLELSEWVWDLSSFLETVLDPVLLGSSPVLSSSEGSHEIRVVVEVSQGFGAGKSPLSSEPLNLPLLVVLVLAVIPGQDSVLSGVPSVRGEAPS